MPTHSLAQHLEDHAASIMPHAAAVAATIEAMAKNLALDAMPPLGDENRHNRVPREQTTT